jgi:hypothetical protein
LRTASLSTIEATQEALRELHDAVLETIHFEWNTAKVEVQLRLSADRPTRCVVTVEGVTSLDCPELVRVESTPV